MRISAFFLALAVPASAQFSNFDDEFLLLKARLDHVRVRAAADRTPDEAAAAVKARLAGSGVPDSYVDAAFADPRGRIFPEIPPKFGTPATPVPPTPYDQYRKYFVTDKNLNDGVAFIRANRALLAQVQAKYHVDSTLLVGLICVETKYGTAAGKYPVFDALNTIVQKVPQRSNWAAKELAEFLKMTHAQSMDTRSVLGSYAGAFGFVQFMPSSYAASAVDFDGDGQKRLDQFPDALGSAANYLAKAGYDARDPFTAGSRVGRALFAYNHSDNYVQVILDLREELLKRNP